MTMVSKGYAGSITTIDYAALATEYGVSCSVGTPGAWKVTPDGSLDRGLRIAAGPGYGWGIDDETDADVVVQGTAVGSGSRWDTVVARRDWQVGVVGDRTTFVVIPGTSTRALPATLQSTPGVVADQPLALVRFAANQTTAQEVVDLRAWHGNGGVLAASDDALAYLDRLGSRVTIGSKLWERILGMAGSPVWRDALEPLRAYALSVATSKAAAAINTAYSQMRAYVDGTFKRDHWYWIGRQLDQRSWPSGSNGQMVQLVLNGAPAGYYLLLAEATVSQNTGTLRALNKLFLRNGAQVGDMVQDDLPSGWWTGRRHDTVFLHTGGNMTLQYVIQVNSDASVRYARITAVFLGLRYSPIL